MLDQNELRTWVLTVTEAVLAELNREDSDLHSDLYDEFGAGRVASFELVNGKLDWFNFRDKACERAEYPMRLKLEFGDGERHTVWVREKSWDLQDRPSRVSRLA